MSPISADNRSGSCIAEWSFLLEHSCVPTMILRTSTASKSRRHGPYAQRPPMEWSGCAPAPPAMEAREGRQRQAVNHHCLDCCDAYPTSGWVICDRGFPTPAPPMYAMPWIVLQNWANGQSTVENGQ